MNRFKTVCLLLLLTLCMSFFIGTNNDQNSYDSRRYKASYPSEVITEAPTDMWSDDMDVSWYDESKYTFNISTPQMMVGLLKLIYVDRITFENCQINLSNDIDLSTKLLTVKSSLYFEYPKNDLFNYGFMGFFNGNNHLIKTYNLLGIGSDPAENSGVNIYTAFYGIFPFAHNAIFENVNVSVNTISTSTSHSQRIGTLVGYLGCYTAYKDQGKKGLITNVNSQVLTSITVKSNSSSSYYFGGIVGCLSRSSIMNCSSVLNGGFYDTYVHTSVSANTGWSYFGGIIGEDTSIGKCENLYSVNKGDISFKGGSYTSFGSIAANRTNFDNTWYGLNEGTINYESINQDDKHVYEASKINSKEELLASLNAYITKFPTYTDWDVTPAINVAKYENWEQNDSYGYPTCIADTDIAKIDNTKIYSVENNYLEEMAGVIIVPSALKASKVTLGLDITDWFIVKPEGLTFVISGVAGSTITYKVSGLCKTDYVGAFKGVISGEFFENGKAYEITSGTDSFIYVPYVHSREGGLSLSSTTYLNTKGVETTIDFSNDIKDTIEGWSWIAADKKLILHVCELYNFGSGIPLNTSGIDIIELREGTTSTITSYSNIALNSTSQLTIQGKGTIVVKTTQSDTTNYSISSSSLVIKEATVIVSGKNGVSSTGSLLITDGATFKHYRARYGMGTSIYLANRNATLKVDNATIDCRILSTGDNNYGGTFVDMVNPSMISSSKTVEFINTILYAKQYNYFNNSDFTHMYFVSGYFDISCKNGLYGSATNKSGLHYTSTLGIDSSDPVTEVYPVTTATKSIVMSSGYIVSYDGNGSTGGEVPFDNKVYAKDPAEQATIKGQGTMVREGYTFAGWSNTNENSLEILYIEDDTKLVESHVKLYAVWVKDIVVTFNSGASNEGNSQVTVCYPKTKVNTLPVVTKNQAVFGGWYTSNTYDTVFDTNTALTGNITVYAKWINGYVITYNSNGGSSVANGLASAATNKIDALPTSPTRQGYIFGGWFNEEAFTTSFTAETSVTGNKTVYAKWYAIFTITYESNGGSSVEASNILETSGHLEALPTAPTKIGYTFKGWYNEEAFTTSFTAETNITENKTVYAKWDANTDTKFKVNYYQKDLTTDTFTLVETDNLTGTTLENTNITAKEYQGFEVISTGSFAWKQEEIKADVTTQINIYYSRKTYHIAYFDAKNNMIEEYTVLYGDSTPQFKSANPQKEEDEFGTYTFKNFGSVDLLVKGDKDYTPVFDVVRKVYKVKLYLNDNDIESSLTSYKAGIEEILPTPKLTDYIFKGWYESKSFTGNPITKIDGTKYGDITLYANWYALKINDTKGSVTYDDGFHQDYVLVIEEVEKEKEVDLSSINEDLVVGVMFDISIKQNNVVVEVDGTINVTIVVPESLAQKQTIKVGYYDGSKVTIYDSTYNKEGGTISFKTIIYQSGFY